VVAQLSTNDVAVHIAVEKLELMEGGHEDHEGHEGHEEHQAHEGHEDHEEHGAHAGHGGLDPHTWLDPLLYRETVGHLAEAIVAIDEANATLYQDNAAALQAQLATLHDTYQSTLSDCSLDAVITSHDAFGYLAKRYEFEVHSIAGLSTQDTPSATTLAELREEAEEGIGAILLEENSVAAYGETLARETGLQTLSVSPIAYIESDDENYLSLMQENLNVFATALQCNA
jgi:zinc transport system substrate-binding protein